jgi:hypothetical protein
MDKQAIIKALRDTAQSASNSAASGLSAPVDLIAWALRKAGADVPTPIGGSDWMEQKGLTKPVEQGVPQVIGETIGGLAPVLAAAKAPQIAAGLNRMIDNAMAPATLGKQRGVVGFKYPQEEALATAQRNAAKPVSEGGLGLHPNNTPMERAQALGYERDVMHGTKNPSIKAFSKDKSNDSLTWVTNSPVVSNQFATDSKGTPTTMLLKAQMRNPADWKVYDNLTLDEFKPRGYDSAWLPDGGESTGFVLEPKQLRSRFAAFDPARRNEADLLGRADPVLLGLLGIGTGAGVAAYNGNK